MEVMNPVNFQQLQQRINGLSKEYFRYSTTVKDRDYPVYKPANTTLHRVQEDTTKLTRHSKSQSHSLIVWGCGEFGQHGLDQSGDVSFEMAFGRCMCGESMLPDGELPVTTVCGSSHTLVLTGTDQLYSWGNGTSGQLGNGTCMTTMKPTLVPVILDGKIQGMSCGARHSFIWTGKGYCYSFGNNFNAQLGYNFSKADFKENQLRPVLVELFPDTRVKQVACGARHSLFLLSTGSVMAVGSNQHGQIGNDTTVDVVIPTVLDDLNSITYVACGNIHSLASHENGSVYAWGYGKAFGNKTRHVAAPQKFTPKDIESNVVSLAGGDCHSMVLYDDGRLFTWGNNYEGQLGVGKEMKYQNEPKAIPCHLLPRPVKEIACGETTSAAVTGKGELFLWGKNAGLIHSDKPSQYFQYIPHHIKMDGLFVTQVSCGAWHVSVIVKQSVGNEEEMSQEVDSESCEAEQPTLFNSELNIPVVTSLGCESEDNIVSEDTTEQQKNKHYWNESTEGSDSSLGSSHIEILEENCYDNDAIVKKNAVETCFITKYCSNSKVENECHTNGMLATDKQLTRYSQNVIVNQHQDCLHPPPGLPDNSNSCKIQLYDVEKTANDTTKIVDSKEEHDESSPFLIRNKTRFQPEGPSSLVKQSDSSGCYLQDKNPTLTYSQKYPLKYTSELEYGDIQNTNNSLLQNKDETSSSAFEDLCSVEFTTEDSVSLANDKRERDKIPNEGTDFSKDVVKDNKFLSINKNDTRNNNGTMLDTKSTRKKDSFVGNNHRTLEVDILEKNRGITMEGVNDLKHSNYPKAKKNCSIPEKNISEDILGSQEQHLSKESLVLRRNIRLAVTPLQNHTIKSGNAGTQNGGNKLATRPVYKFMEQELKKAATPLPNNTIDSNTQVSSCQQAVPVIDLGFGKVVRQAEQSGVKPSFTTFRNVWKASNLFREKQRQKKVGQCNRQASDGMFSLDSMLPNCPVRAGKEIDKWSKMNRDLQNVSIPSNNDTPQDQLRTQSHKSKCCHNKGQVLPPICSCKKNQIVVRNTVSTNIFIDRK